MTDYTWPGDIPNPATDEQEFVYPNQQVFISPFSGANQVATRPGGRWRRRITWQNVTGADRAIVLATFGRLQGAEHRQQIPLFNYFTKDRRGSYGGSPVVNGGGQGGQETLAVRGATASVSDWALRGDFILMGQSIYMITADVGTNSGGNTTLNVAPRIKGTPADGTVIFTGSINGYYRLAGVSLPYSNSDILADGTTASTIVAELFEDISV